jgi:hypothetical protein
VARHNGARHNGKAHQSRVIVVDDSNVAYEEQTRDGKPKVANIAAVRHALEEQGYQPLVIVDASLHYAVDDPNQLEAMIDSQKVRQVPAGTDADFFIIKTAEQESAQILSNDRYGPYHKEYPWVDERRIPFMIINGQVQLYEADKVAPR